MNCLSRSVPVAGRFVLQ